MPLSNREKAIAFIIARIFLMLRELEEEPSRKYSEWEIDEGKAAERLGEDPEGFYTEILKIVKDGKLSLVKIIGAEGNKYFIRLTR